MQHVHDVRAAHARRVVEARLLEAAGLEVRDPLGRVQLHVLLGAEDESARRTGLDAGGLEADGYPIGAQRALVGLVIALRDPRDVERAAGDAIAAADAVLLVEVHDTVRVLHDGAGRRARLQASRIRAMHAAVLADQPLEIPLGILVLRKTHHRPGRVGQVGRVVIYTDVGADLVAKIVPLHAGDLAGLAADAFGGVDELRDRAYGRLANAGLRCRGSRAADDVQGLQGHQTFSTLTRNDLNSGVCELPSPTTGVSVLARKPGLARPVKPQ